MLQAFSTENQWLLIKESLNSYDSCYIFITTCGHTCTLPCMTIVIKPFEVTTIILPCDYLALLIAWDL